MLYGSLLVRLLSEHSPPQSKTKVNQRLNVLPQLLNVKYWLKLIQTLLPQSLSQSMVAALSISVQDGSRRRGLRERCHQAGRLEALKHGWRGSGSRPVAASSHGLQRWPPTSVQSFRLWPSAQRMSGGLPPTKLMET